MKKVYCFIGEPNIEFQASMSHCLSEQFTKENVEIFFLINFDTAHANASYSILEKKIISLPDLSQCDGVIIFPDSYAISGMAEELSGYLAENASCPVVSIRARDDKFYSVTLNDYESICEMTEHFLIHHGMKRVCFMTGRMDLEDAHRRLKAYRDTMAKHSIEVTDDMVFYGDYWITKGDEAADWFLSGNHEPPEAVVCSNDYMAVSLCNAFSKKGYRIPEDICISGFDDIEEIRYHIPPVTSLAVSTQKLSEAALQVFKNVWNGRPQEKEITISLEPKYRNSCGCCTEFDFESFRQLFNEKVMYMSALSSSSYIGLDFESADSIDDLIHSIRSYLSYRTYETIDDNGTVYLCLCDESQRNSDDIDASINFTENMILKAAIRPEKIETPDIVFKRSEILPEKYRKNSVPVYIMNLHCKDCCFGYVVLQTMDISAFNYLIKNLVFSLGCSLDRIRMLDENQTVREQSYRDELTKIPNRRSLERCMNKLLYESQTSGKCVGVMSIDMDGLKTINDTYGHLEGDFAIKTTADILVRCLPESGFIARTGGDEFIALIPSDDESIPQKYIDAVTESLAECNRTLGRKYEFSVSSGYSFWHKGMDIVSCIHKADSLMYADKKARKKQRK